ncbi:hypothetical protein GIB67_023116, partial [Kingdonia uniflora]
MEEFAAVISCFCKTLTCFCKDLQSNTDALKDSVQRRPIPLDSASSTFLQCLNRRVKSVSTDLDFLESMAFGTVSFEELLGNCNELYKNNEGHLVEIEDHLKNFGYIPNASHDFSTPDIRSLRKSVTYHDDELNELKAEYQPTTKVVPLSEVLVETGGVKSVGGSKEALLSISKDDYEKLPSFMRSVASWE